MKGVKLLMAVLWIVLDVIWSRNLVLWWAAKCQVVSQCISLSSGGVMVVRDVIQSDPVWGTDTEMFAVTRGTSPPLQIQPEARGRLDQCVQGEGECFCLWELFPIQNFFLNSQCWSQALGHLMILQNSGTNSNGWCPAPCQATRWFQTALAPSPPCPPSAGFLPGPASEGCHTGAPSTSSPMGFWRQWPLLLKLHIQKWIQPFTFSICLWNWSLWLVPLQEADGTSCYCKWVSK